LVGALRGWPRGHPRELDAVRDDLEQLRGGVRLRRRVEQGRVRGALAGDVRHADPRGAVAVAAPRLVVPGADEDEARIVEVGDLGADRMRGDGALLGEVEEPSRDRPMSVAGAHWDDAGDERDATEQTEGEDEQEEVR